VFQKARDSAPCVIFFDELDSLCPRRSESREVRDVVKYEEGSRDIIHATKS